MNEWARRQSIGFITLCVVTVVLAVALRWRDVTHPPACCDAVGYGHDAQVFRAHGLSESFSPSGQRTYGYPAFVSLALAGVKLTAANSFGYFAHNLAVAQTTLFILAAGALFLALYPAGRIIAWSSVGGLLANPFVVQYLPLRLTEGLTISLAILLTAIAVALATRPMHWRHRAALFFMGGLIAGFSLEVRPANITLLAAWMLFAALHLLFFVPDRRRLIAALIVASITIPMVPQIVHNVNSHGVFTPLPAMDLANMQVKAGARMLKYHTDGAEKRGLAYPNPFSSEDLGGRAATLALHVFHSLNHDYFFTYVFDLDQWRGVALNALNHAVLLLGVVGACTGLSRRFRAKPSSIVASDTAWIFVALVVAATLALNSVVAVETRFGLLIYAAVGPLAVWSVVNARSRALLLGAAALYGVFVATISAYLLADGLLPKEAVL